MELTVSKRTGNLFYRLGITLAALLLVAVVGPRVALAHAHLESSTPADGATVASGLTQVTITFSEEISVDQSNAQLASADGGAISGATSAVDRANRNIMTLTTPALTDCIYTVTWRAVTEDDNGITNFKQNHFCNCSNVTNKQQERFRRICWSQVRQHQ